MDIRLLPMTAPVVNKNNSNKPAFSGNTLFPQGRDEFKNIASKAIEEAHSNVFLEDIAETLTNIISTIGTKTKNYLPNHLNSLLSIESTGERTYKFTHQIESAHTPGICCHSYQTTIDLAANVDSSKAMDQNKELAGMFDSKKLDVHIQNAIKSDGRAQDKKNKLSSVLDGINN